MPAQEASGPQTPPTVHVLTSDPVRLNSVLVAGTDGALLVDTGAGPDQATRILAAARLLTELPLTVVNTHDHWDHFFGNSVFAEAGAVAFLASPAFVRDCAGSAWLQHAEAGEHELGLPSPEQLLVDMTPVQDQETVDLGGASAEFLVLSGHTDTDLAVRVGPVLITGDLVEEGAPPTVGTDATPVAWTRSLARLLSLPGADTFIPGHGTPVGRSFVETQLSDITAYAAAESEGADGHEPEIPTRFYGGRPDTGAGALTGAGGHLGEEAYGVRITRVL